VTRGVTLTAGQLAKLMKQSPTKLDRVLRIGKAVLPKESEIEKAIVQAMVLDGWRPFKMEENFSERKKKKTGEPGMCDHLFLRYRWRAQFNPAANLGPEAIAEVLWWEFKRIRRRPGRRDKATGLDNDQIDWIVTERTRGALVWIAGVDHEATVEGAAQHYLDSGLARRRELFVALIPPEARALPDRPMRLGDG
jgi:hypothetical protein